SNFIWYGSYNFANLCNNNRCLYFTVGNINRNVQKDHSDLLTIINEVLSGIGTIKLQQGEERFTHIFHHTNQELSKGLFKILNLKSIFNSIIVIVRVNRYINYYLDWKQISHL
ncbi:ABC transporter transmembrane domain-containing protein, partial [Streptococcus pluranimalium]|uniref:ABC transporter transmembrane domain-containing protein n=1 Tax=Streptococcus pluranimalium TaxID=82348 RepID=UPI003F691747